MDSNVLTYIFKTEHPSCTVLQQVLYTGEALLDEVEARNLKKSDRQKALNILPGHLSELFSGKRHITDNTALKLEKELGISAEYWIGLQTDYDLAKARRELEAV